MKPEFSEFSFGFAYTYEVASVWREHLLGAPEIPTQNAEGAPGGGYDLRIASDLGLVYFIQYKRSEYMIGTSSAESVFGLPYYRFTTVGAADGQHDLLLELEDQHLADLVEYVAPRFHTQTDLDNHFANQDVRVRSFRLSPSAIGPLPDTQDHRVAFFAQGNQWQPFSQVFEPQRWSAPRITAAGFEGFERPGAGRYGTLEERLTALADRLAASRADVATAESFRGMSAYARARATAAVVLGADVLVYVSDQPSVPGEE